MQDRELIFTKELEVLEERFRAAEGHCNMCNKICTKDCHTAKVTACADSNEELKIEGLSDNGSPFQNGSAAETPANRLRYDVVSINMDPHSRASALLGF